MGMLPPERIYRPVRPKLTPTRKSNGMTVNLITRCVIKMTYAKLVLPIHAQLEAING
jgi:hypothetical protein